MADLLSRRRRILEFLHQFLAEKGYPPSIRDIVKGCEVSSTSVVAYDLHILEREGYIRRDPEISRGIELRGLAPAEGRLARVPIIGTIAAGEPIPVPTSETWNTLDAAETVEVPADLLGRKRDVYALRVRGNSMVDALVEDGDMVLLQATETAENGEMVAAWLKAEKEATLKRFYREKGRVRLQPANVTMKPLYVGPRNVAIQGKVIAVIRRLV